MEKEIPMNKKVFNNKKEESKRLSILKEGNPPIKKNKRKSNGIKNPNICVLNDKMPNTKRTIDKHSKAEELKKNSIDKLIFTQNKYEPISIKEDNINELPYSKAVRLDKRNVFLIFYSFIIQKLELIDIFCGGSKIKIILLGEYILSLLINFFINSLLYTD